MTAPHRQATADTAAPGPMVGADLWQQVVSAAGERCECAGECGSKHRDGHGHCPREDTPWGPLHAVARAPAVSETAEMRMTATELMAVCDRCHGRLVACRRNADRQATAEALAGQEGLW